MTPHPPSPLELFRKIHPVLVAACIPMLVSNEVNHHKCPNCLLLCHAGWAFVVQAYVGEYRIGVLPGLESLEPLTVEGGQCTAVPGPSP